MASFHTKILHIFPYRMNGSMLGRQPFISLHNRCWASSRDARSTLDGLLGVP